MPPLQRCLRIHTIKTLKWSDDMVMVPIISTEAGSPHPLAMPGSVCNNWTKGRQDSKHSSVVLESHNGCVSYEYCTRHEKLTAFCVLFDTEQHQI